MSSVPRNLGAESSHRDFVPSPPPSSAALFLPISSESEEDKEMSQIQAASQAKGQGDDVVMSRMHVLLSPFREHAEIVNSRSNSPATISSGKSDRLYMTGDVNEMKKILAAVRDMQKRRVEAKLCADQEVLKLLSEEKSEEIVPRSMPTKRPLSKHWSEESRLEVVRIARAFLMSSPESSNPEKLLSLMDELLALRTKTKLATRVLFAVSPFMRHIGALKNAQESDWAPYKHFQAPVSVPKSEVAEKVEGTQIPPRLARSNSLTISTSAWHKIPQERGRSKLRGEAMPKNEMDAREDTDEGSANAIAIEQNVEAFERRWNEWQHDFNAPPFEPSSPAIPRSPLTPRFFAPMTPEAGVEQSSPFGDSSPKHQGSFDDADNSGILQTAMGTRAISGEPTTRCRICESEVPTVSIEEHFNCCISEYRDFYADYRLARLVDTLRRLRAQASAEGRARAVVAKAIEEGALQMASTLEGMTLVGRRRNRWKVYWQSSTIYCTL